MIQIDAVMERLAQDARQPLPPPFVFEADRDVPTRPAAVIVSVLDYGRHATILLTKRTAHLNTHAGQVCFPGGMQEESDLCLRNTALRECEEELGIAAEHIHILGELRGRITGTGFHITPFIARIEAPLHYLSPDPFEVEEVFELPLERVLHKATYQKLDTRYDGIHRSHDVLYHEGHCIWGATAGILRDMCRLWHGESRKD